MKYQYTISLAAIAFVACTQDRPVYAGKCNVEAIDNAAISSATETQFQTLAENEISDLAFQLSACLDHPDPDIRDGLAYETLTALLRSGRAEPDLVRGLRDDLFEELDSPDPDGFAHPFAALVLSEVARVDRVSPFLTDLEREKLVVRASNYVMMERDYRGYSDEGGWRHGVAHGADWLMQLALNPELTSLERDFIYDAIRTQVQAHDSHAYIYGEPERLARPLLFAAMRDEEATQDIWLERLTEMADPAPLDDWSDAFQSEADLARLHNLKAFTNVLLVNIAYSENEALKQMEPALIAVMQTLP